MQKTQENNDLPVDQQSTGKKNKKAPASASVSKDKAQAQQAQQAPKAQAQQALSKPKSGDVYVKFRGNDSADWVKFDSKQDLPQLTSEIHKMILRAAGPNPESKSELPINFFDFGGVAEHFLGGRGDDSYCEEPPRIALQNAIIYSFVPTNKKFDDIDKMAKAAEKSGFIGIVIITKKHGGRGKADVLAHLVKQFEQSEISYFEDTAEVLDELVDCGCNSIANMWVIPENPEFAAMVPQEKTGATHISKEYFLNFVVQKPQPQQAQVVASAPVASAPASPASTN